MKLIPISRGLFTMVDDQDFEWLSAYKWHALQKSSSSPDEFYASRYSTGSHESRIRIWMHREIAMAPEGRIVDHKNGNTLDNRRDNLRTCVNEQNRRNQKLNRLSTSGFNGVTFIKIHNRWRASIKIDGRRLYFGEHLTAEGAAKAYDLAAIQLHGEFAKLNFPQTKEQ